MIFTLRFLVLLKVIIIKNLAYIVLLRVILLIHSNIITL